MQKFIQSRKPVPPEVMKKIKGLVEVAKELPHGKSFNITRLTVIKSLCADWEVASAFVLHLAQLTKERMQRQKAEYISAKKWQQHKELVNEAVPQLSDYLGNRKTQKREAALRETLDRLRQLQDNYEQQRWGPVRLIDSSETLVVEKAFECVLSEHGYPFWAYHVAREYAERYDSKYGTGLNPESAPFMNDIASFWVRLYGLESQVR
jgi:hypothetical protein